MRSAAELATPAAVGRYAAERALSRLKSRKIANLYYTGQLTVPGPGVPPAIISGQVVADLIEKEHARKPIKA